MTTATFTSYECVYTLTLKGHADFDHNGHDLVCSATSLFATSLAETIDRLEKMGKVMNVNIKLEPGDTEIIFRPRNQLVELTLTTYIESGLQLLNKAYPENINIDGCDFLAK